MADLPKRTKEEKNLTLAILLLLSSIDDSEMGGGFLSASYFYDKIQETSIPRLSERVYLFSAGGMLNEIGVKGDAGLRDFLSERSDSYSRQLAERMSGNQNEWYRDIQSRRSDYDLNRVDSDYTPSPSPYGKYEAAREAVTSISAMNSDSQKMTSQYLNDFMGVKTTFVWIPERDSKTCKVCKRMGGTYEEFWSQYFPEGPPAHPNCRCFLSSIQVYAS